MTDRELMQQALDALEDVRYIDQNQKAIEALRARLAQPEPDAYGYATRLAEAIYQKHYKEDSPEWRPLDTTLGVLTQIDNMTCRLVKTQPEPEPVAWVQSDFWNHLETFNCGTAYRIEDDDRQPLYTAPPQREWQGLTDEEIKRTDHHRVDGAYDYSFKQGARWAEAKLKEKNT